MNLLQRLRVLIGYDLSDEALLELACREHLDARARLEEAETRLQSALQEQQAAGERLARLSADRAPAGQLRQVKDSVLEALGRAGATKQARELALAARDSARELQKQRFNHLVQLEGSAFAQGIVQDALASWWEDRVDDGESWWQG